MRAIREKIPATLVLEDGTTLRGWSFGARGETTAEIIFHTGMTGYQEVITDPSYRGQMVIMTYPLIGNYGIVPEVDDESWRPQVSAFIVRELSALASNWRAALTLHEFLATHGVLGIEGIDTRALVLHVRNAGAMRAALSTERHDPAVLRELALSEPPMDGRDLVKDVTTDRVYEYQPNPKKIEALQQLGGSEPIPVWHSNEGPFHVVAYDFGVKRNILDLLYAQGCRLTVVPARTKAEDVLAMKPDGVFLSNGPGDPAALTDIIEQIRILIGQVPIFGICLGHQLLGLALGGTTYKLKFGHHGANHPVRDVATNRVEITSQNHGFCVDIDSLPSSCTVTHINLNDDTVEGFMSEELRLFCVQHHPEAAPGPHDATYMFSRFREWMARQRAAV